MKKILILLIFFIFVYQPMARIIYVDQTITDSCRTYDPIARDCGGSEWAFKTIQMATDSMSVGDTVQMRGGTYQQGQIRLRLSGNSWAIGQFNTLMSKPGEWAIIDGKDSIASTIGGEWPGIIAEGATALHFWKFEKFEIMRGKNTGGDAEFNDRTAAFQLWHGPYWFSRLYIHDNICPSSNENPAGLSLHATDSCIIEYCYFENNGSSTESHNSSHIVIYSDYHPTTNAENGYDGSSYANRRNIIRYNYFGPGSTIGIKDKTAQLLSGRNVSGGHGYDDTYEEYGNEIYKNYFYGLYEEAIFCATDFTQIHHNVIDSCGLGIRIDDEYMAYRVTVYNNTIKNCTDGGVAYLVTDQMITGSYTTEKDNYSYTYNNLLDSVGSAYNREDITHHVPSATPYMTFLNTDIRHNWTYRPRPSSDTIVIWQGTDTTTPHKFSISQYKSGHASFVHWRTTYSSGVYSGTDSTSRYKTVGTFSISGDTTISSGGIGGSHPFLAGITLPSNVGAASSSDLWIDTVMNLQNIASDTTTDTTGSGCDTTCANDSIQIKLYKEDTLYVDTSILYGVGSFNLPILINGSTYSAVVTVYDSVSYGASDSISFTVSDSTVANDSIGMRLYLSGELILDTSIVFGGGNINFPEMSNNGLYSAVIFAFDSVSSGTSDSVYFYTPSTDTTTANDSVAVQVSTSSNFSSPTIDTAIPYGNFVGIVLPEHGTYYARCAVFDSVSYGAWSDTIAFNTENPPPPDSSTLNLTQSTGGTVSADPAAAKRQAGDQSVISAVPSLHYHFVAWQGDLADSVDNPLTYNYLSAGTFTGSALFGLDSFGLAYTITGGNAAVTFFGDSIAAYNESITCTLTVDTGYVADGPFGHVGAGKHPLTVVMTKDSTLAVTTHARPEYTVDTTWGGYLSAWTVAGGLTHDSGTTVTMLATCEACSSFAGYTGDYTGANRNGSFVITGNVSIGAGCEYGTCASGNKRILFGFLRSFRFGWR